MKNLGISLFFVCLFGCADEASNVFSETGGGGAGGTGESGGAGGKGGNDNWGQGGKAGGDVNVGGSSGSSCVPKTCATIAVELNNGTSGNPEACGLAPDGCGGYVECGGCESPHHGCGLGSYEIPNTTNQKLPGIENLCGGNCAKQNNIEKMFDCPNGLSGEEWLCSKQINSLQNCEPACDQLPCSLWCCNN